ncbi:MAG: Bug family tripartite tricarboxylate transporter substrate binding protein [Thermodesulfobacteriota bacterium]
MIRTKKPLRAARHDRRHVLLFFLLCGIGLVTGWCGSGITPGYGAEAFPSGKITWVVGFQPGGGEDVMARGLAPYLEKYLKAVSPNPGKVAILIKNLPGGGEVRAINEIYHGRPDGYTIGNGGERLHILTMTGELPFDFYEMTYIARLSSSHKILVATRKSDLLTWEDVVKASKSGPVKLALSGFGGSNYIAYVFFMDTTGLALKPVIFDGTAGANSALIRGDVPISINSEDSLKNLIEIKELRPLVTFTDQTKFPGVPTIKEVGFPELVEPVRSQRYLIAPPKLPGNIKRIYEEALKKVFADKEFIAWNQRAKITYDPVFGSDFDNLIKTIQGFYKKKEKVLKENLPK